MVDYVNEKTKYYNGIRLTNYQDGDEIILKNNDVSYNSTPEELQENNAKLKIKKVTDKFPKNLVEPEKGPIIIGTEETVYSVIKQFYNKDINKATSNNEKIIDDDIFLKVSDITITNKFIEFIKDKYNLNDYNITNSYKQNINSISGNKMETQEIIDNDILLTNVFVYSFIGIITLVGILNMYNAISANLEIRKREVVSLITLGIEEKQINKMLFIENLICGMFALILGISLGLAASNVIYLTSIDYMWYAFEIPWLSIVFSTIGIILVILISTIYLKKKIFTNNLIEVLKEEDI